MDAEPSQLCNVETKAGNLVTDSLLWMAGDADVAFHNAGGFRLYRVFLAGDITRADAHELFPFGNRLILMDLTWEQLGDELEYCISGSWGQMVELS